MKTFTFVMYCITLAFFSVIIAFFMCRALDTQWEEGIYNALNKQEVSFHGHHLEYDEYGAPTKECIDNLKKTVFNGRKFDENRLYTGHCIPSEDEMIELERIFSNISEEYEYGN